MATSVSANNTFYKTYTGTDTLVFVIFPETKPILLGTLTTLSYSIFREKRPVPLLGKINTGGYTRGMRTIAGSMIFTVINQHFIQDVIKQVPYLKAHEKFKVDELPFFDVMVVCANEYGSTAQMMLYGVEFLDDAQVISINDMFIENTFGFVARDIDMLTSENPLVKKASNSTTESGGAVKGASATVDTVMPYDLDVTGYKDFMNKTLSSTTNDKLYESQLKLKELDLLEKATGVLDNETLSAISEFQRKNNIKETGYIDDVTYNVLFDTSDSKSLLAVTNKNGSFVYSDANKSSIIGISKYGDNYLGNAINDMVNIEFYGKDAYVDVSDTSLAPSNYIDFTDLMEPNVIHKIDIDKFNPSYIGSTIFSEEDIEVKLTAIASYSSEDIKTFSKYITINKGDSVGCTLSMFEFEGVPNSIEFLINTNNNVLKKWIIKIIK